jgi:hypothetical protein
MPLRNKARKIITAARTSWSKRHFSPKASSDLELLLSLNVRFAQNRFSFLACFFIIPPCVVDLMAASDDTPSETSPLLGPDSDCVTPKALNGNGTILPDGAPQDGAYLERHDSIDERRAAQFEGRPDIRKQLKYILPAISIGVLKALICLVAPADPSEGFLVRSGSNNHCFHLWQSWERTWCTQPHQLDCNVLLPDLVIIPTALRETQRHFRPKGVPTLVLRYIRPGIFVLWSGSGYQSTDCSSSEWSPMMSCKYTDPWGRSFKALVEAA